MKVEYLTLSYIFNSDGTKYRRGLLYPKLNSSQATSAALLPNFFPNFARYLYPTYTGLRADLAEYLHHYNTDRTHTGRITQGRIPIDIIDPAHKMRPPA